MQKAVFMHFSWYSVSCFSFAMAMPVLRIHVSNPCIETTETSNADMRNPKSLTPISTVAKIRGNVLLIIEEFSSALLVGLQLVS